jgi:hypothetical protein
MIQATITKQWIGDPAKVENLFNIYTLINIFTDTAIPALGLNAGDVLSSNVQILVSDIENLYQQINNHVTSHEKRIANMLFLKANPISQATIVDPSLYRPIPQVPLTEEEKAKMLAEQEYQQKRQELITAKQNLDIGIIALAEFDKIKAEVINVKPVADVKEEPIIP